MKQIRAVAKKIAAVDARREVLVAERDELMRAAKSQGATWDELQDAAGMASPTAVSRALKRGTELPSQALPVVLRSSDEPPLGQF